ncbi:MAG TPA: histidine phosphatase family protein, partial [Acidimicrobiales bacterium]|nr:histidine phosphatase family protein [Acidimicrobiales bacterium]
MGGRKGCSGLTPKGVVQAELLKARLERSGELAGATALYSSVLPRAGETATIISPAVGDGTLRLVEDCGVCELHPGEADGLSWEGFLARYPEPDWDLDPHAPLAPGGESWASFVGRASGAVERLAKRHVGSELVVVCHAGVVEATMI